MNMGALTFQGFFRRLLAITIARPWVTVLFCLLTAAGCGVLALFRLEVMSGRNELVTGRTTLEGTAYSGGPEQVEAGNPLSYDDRYLAYQREFGDEEHAFLVADIPRTAANLQHWNPDWSRETALMEARRHCIELTEDFAARCRAEASRPAGDRAVESVFCRFDPTALGGREMLFMDMEPMRRLAGRIHDSREFLREVAANPSLAAVFASTNRRLKEAQRENIESEPDGPAAPGDGPEKRLDDDLRFLDLLVNHLRARVRSGAAYTSVLESLFLPAGLEPKPDDLRAAGYLTCRTKSQEDIFLLTAVMPRKDYTTLNYVARSMEWLRATLAEVKVNHRDVAAELTGQPVLNDEEMGQSNRDMTLATIVTTLLIALFLIFVYREVIGPLLCMVVLLVGVGWSVGFIVLCVGHLNLLSVIFNIILAGVGVDYGIHFFTRFREALRRGATVDDALLEVVDTTSRGLWTGAATTAAAFFTALAVDFKGLQELGLITGAGMLLVLASTMIMLPPLCVLARRHFADARFRSLTPRLGLLTASVGAAQRHPRAVLALTALAVAASVALLPRLDFRYNLLDLQAEGLPAVQYEREIMANSDRATIEAVMVADDAAHLADLERRVKRLRSERGVPVVTECVLDYPRDQAEKLALAETIRADLADARIPDEGPRFSPVALAASLDDLSINLAAVLAHLQERIDGAPAAVKERVYALGDAARVLSEEIRAEHAAAPARCAARAGAFEAEFLGELRRKLDDFVSRLPAGPVHPDDLPPFLASRLVGKSGKLALLVYPEADIYDHAPMRAFYNALSTIDGNVTGAVVQILLSSEYMKRGFESAAVYAALAILALLFLDFRHLPSLLLALMPLAVGALVTSGAMAATDTLRFNLANFFAVPILLGIGIDDGVHIVHRFRQCGDAGEAARNTGLAVVMTSVTTATGFLCIGLLSHHRGIQSFGYVLAIGVMLCMATSLWALPALLSLLYPRGMPRRADAS
ncbi:MAG: MMPL family transporter [Planctomycetes bacterium]|nr:MMPL family transporter [Planctomycetota bacterium]